MLAEITSWRLPAALLVLVCACATSVPGYATPDPIYRLPGGVAAADDPFIAAGFRALFTCSAHFVMGRQLADILRVELADTTALNLPDPEIDSRRNLVRAADGNGTQRIAVFRDTMGCTVLPPHWTEADAARLPYLARNLGDNPANVDYPLGDHADPAPTVEQNALLKRAFDATTYGDGTLTVGVLILKDGQLRAEAYRDGFGIHTGYRTWSTAKSISATLIGIAVKQGLVKLDAPAPIPQWQQPADPRRTITPRHLLWMSSGLWGGGNNTNAVYFGGQDAISAITGTHLEATPGQRWKYANNDTLLLLYGLRQALGNDTRYLRYPYNELFDQIGMHHTWMETDHLGNIIGSSQVYTTARDLGRLGTLYLNDGVWDGQRLLPEGWAKFVATPAPSRPAAQGEQGYGAQFWLFDQLPGIPAGTYTSAGNKGQFATVIPAHDMVVVRTGVDPLGRRWRQPAFVTDVIEAFSD
jgi:CubicO group peptidase (beta-lactamase class C family)